MRLLEIAYTQKASGMTLIPLEILQYLESRAGKDELESKWQEAEVSYGKYLKEKFNSPVKVLGELLKGMRWELDEIDIKDRWNC